MHASSRSAHRPRASRVAAPSSFRAFTNRGAHVYSRAGYKYHAPSPAMQDTQHCTHHRRTRTRREKNTIEMTTTTKPWAAAACATVLLLSAAATMEAEAAGCDARQLTPCAGPALFGGAVPAACCVQLRAQQGCLCGYARSPNYGAYLRSPNARRLFAVCNLPAPRCG
ncbi:unnamed protein product [Urochloa humidicola]